MSLRRPQNIMRAYPPACSPSGRASWAAPRLSSPRPSSAPGPRDSAGSPRDSARGTLRGGRVTRLGRRCRHHADRAGRLQHPGSHHGGQRGEAMGLPPTRLGRRGSRPGIAQTLGVLRPRTSWRRRGNAPRPAARLRAWRVPSEEERGGERRRRRVHRVLRRPRGRPNRHPGGDQALVCLLAGNFTRIRIPTTRRRTRSFSASARRIRCSATSRCAKSTTSGARTA